LVDEVVYVSRVAVTRKGGPVREARLPGREEPITFGVHSEIAEHYGVNLNEYPPDAATLDYVVAAAGG
jgi:hypothetical protein